MDTKILDSLTLGCLESIAQMQEVSGAFLSISRSLYTDTPERVYVSPFFTGLIVHALSVVPSRYRMSSHIQKQACNFLLSQQSRDYSFNYWQRKSDMAREFPYPDDLDDTFSIHAALTGACPEIYNGTALAHIARLLIATETSPGGPYKTWLSQESVTAQGELVPDIAVNANIAYFLKLQGLTVEPLVKYLHAHVESGTLTSRYYPSTWPVVYFLARSVPRVSYALLARYIEKESYTLDARPGILFCALRLSALIIIKAKPDLVASAYDSLTACLGQKWLSSPFCFDPVVSGHRYGAGSEALTRALVLEAFWLFKSTYKPRCMIQPTRLSTSAPPSLSFIVHEFAAKRIQTLPREISHRAEEAHTALRCKDIDNQIALLPMWFSMEKLKPGSAAFDAAISIGVASVFGWIAYTIYDTSMDTAEGSRLLPIANTLLLELACIYFDLLKNAPAGLTLFKSLMSRMEAGNMWELTHARTQVVNGLCWVPKHDISFSALQPAEKSLGHALGPLIFSFIQNEQSNTFDGTDILSFFEHYLTARQLNDDAHDWFEDISRGHITMVNSTILRVCSKGGKVDIIGQKLSMQRYFWNAVLPDIAQRINYHTAQARAVLSTLCLPEAPHLDAVLLEPLERSARTALTDSANASLFLKAYA